MEDNPYQASAVSGEPTGSLPLWLIVLRAMLLVLMPLLLVGGAVYAFVVLLMLLDNYAS